jgi:hypothetical protein
VGRFKAIAIGPSRKAFPASEDISLAEIALPACQAQTAFSAFFLNGTERDLDLAG